MRVRLGLITALSLPLLFACSSRAQTTDPTVAAADAAYDAKRYAEAIPLYRSVVVSKLSDDVRARAQIQIGWSCYFLGDRKQAQAEFTAVADEFPDQAAYVCSALLRAGNSAAGAHDLDAAITAYRRCAENAHAEEAVARTYAAQASCWLGNACTHRAETTKTLAAAAISSGGGIPKTKDVWDAASTDFEDAVRAYSRVVTAFSESPLVAEAAMHLVALKYEFAMYDRDATFRDVVSAADQFILTYPKARKQLAVVYQVRAEAMYADGKYDEALHDLRLVQNDLGDVAGQALGTSQYFVARCYERMGEYDRSICEFQKFLIEGKPSFLPESERAAARFAIGVMQWLKGNRAEARAAFELVIGENPGTRWESDAREEISNMDSEVTK